MDNRIDLGLSSSKLAVTESSLPNCLRPVAPFFEEAQVISRNIFNDEHKANVAIYCIDHAFKLIENFRLQIGIFSIKFYNLFLF